MATTFQSAWLAMAALPLAACGPADRQAPAPTESLVPLPSAQPAPPGPTTEASSSPAVTPEGDECGASKLGKYLNQLPTTDAMDGIRDTIGHDRIRAINPGDMVTQDFRPDRLNIEIGEDGRIKHFRCG